MNAGRDLLGTLQYVANLFHHVSLGRGKRAVGIEGMVAKILGDGHLEDY